MGIVSASSLTLSALAIVRACFQVGFPPSSEGKEQFSYSCAAVAINSQSPPTAKL